MGNQLAEQDSLTRSNLTEVFNRAFPFYLSLGMDYETFWYKDVTIVKHYNAMVKIKNERTNYNAWLYGLYFDKALLHGLSTMFSESSSDVIEYPNEPYKEEEETKQELTEEEQAFQARSYLEALNAMLTNKK